MNDTQAQLLEFLGSVVAYGGGGAAVAFLLFQWLGKRWIENRFTERLEQLKHDQAVVVAKLRIEVESTLSGALKIQEREFQVLPAVWEKLDHAFANVVWLCSAIQMHADVRALSTVQLEEHLAPLDWTESQKDEVRTSDRPSRNDVYQAIEYRYRAAEVRTAFGDYQRYLAANAIFLPDSLKTKLKEFERLMWAAISAKQLAVETKEWKLAEKADAKISDECPPLKDSIEAEIRRRLESHMRAAKEKASAGEALEN